MNRSHVTRALEDELADPRRPDPLAADMALAGLTVLAFAAANSVAPVAGGAAVAVAAVAAGPRLRDALARSPDHVVELVDAELMCRALPQATPAWSGWVPWDALAEGREVDVPAGLEHPREVGFEPTRLAKYVGQAADYVHPLVDGSRLHAHEFADGSVTLHRDRIDPARGPATAAVHWMSETPEGGAVGVVLTAAAIGTLMWAVAR